MYPTLQNDLINVGLVFVVLLSCLGRMTHATQGPVKRNHVLHSIQVLQDEQAQGPCLQF